MLPAAGVVDHGPAQDSGRPIEIEKQSAARASHVFQDKMPVEQHRLDFSKDVVMAIQIRPPRLDHSDLGIGKLVHRALQEIDRRNKIGVENRDNLASRGLETVLQRTGLVSGAIAAMNVLDG